MDKEMVRALVAYGANLTLDNVPIRDRLSHALERFPSHGMQILSVSHWYSTPAYPVGSGDDFLNGVALVETGLDAKGILAALGEIEREMGRVRRTRWGPRVTDLDVIAVEDLVMPDVDEQRRWRELPEGQQRHVTPGELILPHPRLQDRSFVLYPLRDVAPDWVHPVTGLSVEEMIAALPAERHAEISVVQ